MILTWLISKSKSLLSSYLFVSYSSIYFIRFSMNILRLSSLWWAQVDSNHRPRAYQARALTTWAMSPCKFRCISSSLAFGGDDGNRTHDPLLAGQVLSQLSYTPIYLWGFKWLTVTQNWTTSEKYSLCKCTISRRLFGFGLLLNYKSSMTRSLWLTFSIERRWSSRTFRYGYLVTT